MLHSLTTNFDKFAEGDEEGHFGLGRRRDRFHPANLRVSEEGRARCQCNCNCSLFQETTRSNQVFAGRTAATVSSDRDEDGEGAFVRVLLICFAFVTQDAGGEGATDERIKKSHGRIRL